MQRPLILVLAASFALFVAPAALLLHTSAPAAAPPSHLHAVTGRAEESPPGLTPDCLLDYTDTCSGWIWIFDGAPGEVWGEVFDPQDCPTVVCTNGGTLLGLNLYSRSSAGPVTLANLQVHRVDAAACRTDLLYETGPFTVTHCIPGDGWTTVMFPYLHLQARPIAISLTLGSDASGEGSPHLVTDNMVANLYCHREEAVGYPGCATPDCDCAGWSIPPERSFIYVMDADGDGDLDDLCALYGAPFPLVYPLTYAYGLPYTNNLLIHILLDCFDPQAAEEPTWGRVKALFE